MIKFLISKLLDTYFPFVRSVNINFLSSNIAHSNSLHFMNFSIRTLLSYLKAIFTYLFKKEKRAKNVISEDFKYCLLVVIGSIPAGLVGILFKDFIEEKEFPANTEELNNVLYSPYGAVVSAVVFASAGILLFKNKNKCSKTHCKRSESVIL